MKTNCLTEQMKDGRMGILEKIDKLLVELSVTKTSDDFAPKIVKKSKVYFSAEFTTLGTPYTFIAGIRRDFDLSSEDRQIANIPAKISPEIWEVSFSALDTSGKVASSNADIKVGFGKSLLVWGNIQQCLSMFVKEEKPEAFYFTGATRELDNLYSKLATQKATEQATSYKYVGKLSSTGLHMYAKPSSSYNWKALFNSWENY